MIDQKYPYYLLDEHGNEVGTRDIDEWGLWYDKVENRIIGQATYSRDRKEILVSTIFLGIPHHSNILDDGELTPSMLYETMVLANESIIRQIIELSESETRSFFAQVLGKVDIQKRYRTRDEAVKGHQQMCEFVESCLPRLQPLNCNGK